MARNTLPSGEQALIDYVTNMKAGANIHGVAIGLTHHTHTSIAAALAAASTARTQLKTADTALSAHYIALETASDAVGDWLGTARDSFKPVFGKQWSPAWNTAGWDDGSTAVDRKPEQRRDRIEKVIAFLTATPARENAGMDVTVIIAQPLFDTLSGLLDDLPEKESTLTTKKMAKDAAIQALRNEAAGMISELGDLLDPLDPLWEAFGLKKPGSQQTPPKVLGLQVTLVGPTAAAARWLAAARTNYYRVWIQIAGVDLERRAVGSPADLDFTIDSLTPGSTVTIWISAVNDGGEGPLSEPVTVTTHA